MNLTVSEKIRVLLGRLDVSVTDLAAKTGQTRQNLSNKMNRGNFTEKDIEAIASALGCSVEIVFTLPDGTTV